VKRVLFANPETQFRAFDAALGRGELNLLSVPLDGERNLSAVRANILCDLVRALDLFVPDRNQPITGF
jgi:hypothetical protein